jgi:hypothetical protein
MADVGYVLLMVLFTVIAMLFVIGCDKIIGPDEPALSGEDPDDQRGSGART